MPGGWDLRSNIGPKQNSQGTLFRAADKSMYNPAVRWPRGYAPERLNEVREGLKNTVVTPPPKMYEAPDDEVQREHGVNAFGYRARVEGALAKSTVPARDLRGLQEIHGQPVEGTSGTYWPRRREMAVDITAPGSDRTIIHELGHHNDLLEDTSRNLRREAAPAHAKKIWWPKEGEPNVSTRVLAEELVDRGVSEAVADNYYEKHYRSGGRKSRPDTGGGLYEQSLPDAGIRESRYPGYTHVRPPAHLGPQFSEDSLPGIDRDLAKKGHL